MRDDRTIRARETVRRLKLERLYPFEPRFADTPQGAMHYVDEGSDDGAGEGAGTVLCLHGNPTWSFLYRDVIAQASKVARVVAPDHIGFGLSDEPTDEAAYSIDGHIRNLEALVTGLDLRNVTLVVQDWGGPIGLGLAARHPERIARLAILNTFGFYPLMKGVDPDRLRLPPLLLMRARFPGTWLVRGRGFFERRVMRLATANAERLRQVHHAYKGVFQGREDRAGVMAFPRLIPTSTRHPSDDHAASVRAYPDRGDRTVPRRLRRSRPHLVGHEGPALPRQRARRLARATAERRRDRAAQGQALRAGGRPGRDRPRHRGVRGGRAARPGASGPHGRGAASIAAAFTVAPVA